jgi:hypothetical protein
MANTPKEKTAKQKATEAAYKALVTAREALEKSNNAHNKTALANAETAYNNARDAERRERFTTVGRDRAELVSVKLAALAKCANLKGYQFTSADIDKIETVLKEDLESTIAAFRTALTGKSPAAKGGRLSFD